MGQEWGPGVWRRAKARGPGGAAWREPRLLTAFHVSGVRGVRGDRPGEGGAPQEFTRQLPGSPSFPGGEASFPFPGTPEQTAESE